MADKLHFLHSSAFDKALYDFDESAENAARKAGCVIVYPADNQLQIDLDSEDAYEEFQQRYYSFGLKGERCTFEEHLSKSGLPKRHITITFAERKFTEAERIAIQAALGSDPMREFLNAMRLYNGTEKPTRLFEKLPTK